MLFLSQSPTLSSALDSLQNQLALQVLGALEELAAAHLHPQVVASQEPRVLLAQGQVVLVRPQPVLQALLELLVVVKRQVHVGQLRLQLHRHRQSPLRFPQAPAMVPQAVDPVNLQVSLQASLLVNLLVNLQVNLQVSHQVLQKVDLAQRPRSWLPSPLATAALLLDLLALAPV